MAEQLVSELDSLVGKLGIRSKQKPGGSDFVGYRHLTTLALKIDLLACRCRSVMRLARLRLARSTTAVRSHVWRTEPVLENKKYGVTTDWLISEIPGAGWSCANARWHFAMSVAGG